MTYYSAIKRNEAMLHATMWVSLENVMLGKGNRYFTILWFHPYEMFRIGKSYWGEVQKLDYLLVHEMRGGIGIDR